MFVIGQGRVFIDDHGGYSPVRSHRFRGHRTLHGHGEEAGRRRSVAVRKSRNFGLVPISRVLPGSDVGNTKFPIVTIAHYGSDDKHTTKIVAGVILHSTAEPILSRFVGSKTSEDPKVQLEIDEFLSEPSKETVFLEGNMGCPHEEGEDFPVGCLFCPFWADKQGTAS